MTTQELIAILKTQDQNATVVLSAKDLYFRDDHFYTVNTVTVELAAKCSKNFYAIAGSRDDVADARHYLADGKEILADQVVVLSMVQEDFDPENLTLVKSVLSF